jgi:hypothetical protein
MPKTGSPLAKGELELRPSGKGQKSTARPKNGYRII